MIYENDICTIIKSNRIQFKSNYFFNKPNQQKQKR